METSNPPLRAIGGPNPGRGLFTILGKGRCKGPRQDLGPSPVGRGCT